MAEKSKKDFIPFTQAEEKLIHKIVEERLKVESRFPLFFLLLATFGFVSVLYGFEKMIDSLPFLADKPWLIFVTGLATLVVTGTTYRKLG